MNCFTWILRRGPWPALMALMVLWGAGLAAAQSFLPVDQAFVARLSSAGPQALQVDMQLARGVYLYRERFEAKVQVGATEVVLAWALPSGDKKYDPNFEKTVEVYHTDVSGRLALPSLPAGEHVLTLVYQGCADAGLCYPPQKRLFTLSLDARGHINLVAPRADVAARASPLAAVADKALPDAGADAGADRITRALASGQWWVVVPAFALAGLLLSLTPCVLPMVPILSSIIVGQKGQVSRGRGLALALSYSQGMALVYTALGVAAGLLGQGLAAYLQHPWVVLGFAALMVLLALSMFGLYELQLPASLQSALGAGSSRLPGGRFVSVFAMGVVSALVVSPCVSAPLAGALLYISQTRDVWLGGSALYAMAWGMSVPLLLVGLSAGSVLPRTGPWMKAVKALFGVLMLGMALWVARPAWPYVQSLVGMAPATSTHRSVLPFAPIKTEAELDRALAQARAQGRPVMIDFYADWCTACIEMERATFRDPQVQLRLQGAVLLQVDVTLNTADDRALLQRFKLFGPPGMLFVNAQGQAQPQAQVVGFQPPAEFLQSLQKAGL